MINLLKNPAEYAAQLLDCYAPSRWHVAAFEAARAHTLVPAEFFADVHALILERCDERRRSVERILRDMAPEGWDYARASLEYDLDPAQRF